MHAQYKIVFLPLLIFLRIAACMYALVGGVTFMQIARKRITPTNLAKKNWLCNKHPGTRIFMPKQLSYVRRLGQCK